MNLKLSAVALAALLTVAGGAAAVTSTGAMNSTATDDAPHDAAVAATDDNGTVTVTVTNAGDGVENATVELADGEYTTGPNGTVTAENVSVEDELEVEVQADAFEAELSYAVQDGDLVLRSEEYQYGDDHHVDRENDDHEEHHVDKEHDDDHDDHREDSDEHDEEHHDGDDEHHDDEHDE